MILIVLALSAAVLILLLPKSPFATAQEPLPDLTITKTAEPNPVPNNSTLTYTIVVSNIGDAPAGSAELPIRVVDVFSADFSLESFEVTPAGTCHTDSGTLLCEFTTIGQGESVTITASGTLSTEDNVVYNTALVDLPISRVPESIDTLNNITSIETSVLQPVGGISLSPALRPLPTQTGRSNGFNVAVLLAALGIVALGVALRTSLWLRKSRPH